MEEKLTVKAGEELEVPMEISKALSLTTSRISKLNETDFVNSELYAPVSHILKNEGKLVRPGLLFSSAHMLGLDPIQYVDLAAGIELLHTASLVHDDIIDKDTVRRGKDSVHVKFGTERAILTGDALIAKAIGFASQYGSIAVNRASQAAMDMCAGEALDYGVQNGKGIDLHQYLRIAQLKTASLVATSTSIVADCTGSDSRDILYEIGLNIGYSFQLRDDIMNYSGVSDRKAKGTKTDIKNSRPNIVMVFESHGKGNPLKTAVKLNSFYLDRAKELLLKLENMELFEYYLKFLEIA